MLQRCSDTGTEYDCGKNQGHPCPACPSHDWRHASDLYDAGLTSLTTVNLMLAIEDQFDIEFPDHMLGRKTFGSIQALCEAVEELVS